MGAIDNLYEEQFSDMEARREFYRDYYSRLRKVQNMVDSEQIQEGERSVHKGNE